MSWKGESQRHSLCARGIKSIAKSVSKSYPKKFRKLYFQLWLTAVQIYWYDYEEFKKEVQNWIADPRYMGSEVHVYDSKYGSRLAKYRINRKGEFEKFE